MERNISIMENVLRHTVVTGYQNPILLAEPPLVSGSYFPIPANQRIGFDLGELSLLETTFRETRLTCRAFNKLVVPIFFKENWFVALTADAIVQFVNHLPPHWRVLVRKIILRLKGIFLANNPIIGNPEYMAACIHAENLMRPQLLLPFLGLTHVEIRLQWKFTTSQLRTLPIIASLREVRIIREREVADENLRNTLRLADCLLQQSPMRVIGRR